MPKNRIAAIIIVTGFGLALLFALLPVGPSAPL